ncbi:MAG: TrbG/VirB9 family P-type conjugative transfer protein [Acidobacteriaceae bacterium]
MKSFLITALALFATAAGAQTTNFNQVPHIETALNHLTVIDLGEPVTTLAVADPDAFQVERHDDKVFLKPLKEGASTNLFVWTATRQLSYELDPAGDLQKMNVLIRNAPSAVPARIAMATEPTDQDIQKIASLVLTQALMGTEEIARDGSKAANDRVTVELEQVFRAKDVLYLRYSITNSTRFPFRITAPDVREPQPTQVPISLLSLRDHQLSSQTFATFKTKPGASIPVMHAESQTRDLAPGQKTTGIVSIPSAQQNPPHIYQLIFGSDHDFPVTVEAVL